MAKVKDIRVDTNSGSNYFTSPILQIRVGQEDSDQETFAVHEDLICLRSAFFKNAMNGSWIESARRLITLPEDNPHTFELYLNIIYNGCLPVIDECPKVGQFETLTTLYVLAEKLMDRETKNLVVQAMIARRNETFIPKPDCIRYLYENTPENNLGRKLFVDFIFRDLAKRCISVTEVKAWRRDMPVDFLFDFGLRMMEIHCQTRSPAFAFDDPTEYLEQDEQETSNSEGKNTKEEEEEKEEGEAMKE
ncbi:hypothetical protein K505DRAFT_358595 [Melanomma pulvis-pyrius CBS 109.77]|uniref:BTB domain-containing protein n=1 Tax=Melanomma pulvis-pyrius CBS 109.77 TaxID=1314802 RepID=A0A6A6XLX8_9PLEO|nr:hypothetical protein K505DRAFT_358595 [Melanomma pulvis-pyrius CBS 109.77]